MKYELIDLKYCGSPQEIGDGTFIQVIETTTGISGDTYGFVCKDNFNAVALMSDTADQIKQKFINQAVEFVANKYPNT